MLAILRQRNFALLWFGSLVSLTGDWLLRIGLPVYIYVLTGSALQTGIMFIAGNIPMLFSSFAGVLVDRWDRRRTMIICSLLQAVGLLALLFAQNQSSLWIIYAVQFFEACISQITLPAESALIPLLVSKPHSHSSQCTALSKPECLQTDRRGARRHSDWSTQPGRHSHH